MCAKLHLEGKPNSIKKHTLNLAFSNCYLLNKSTRKVLCTRDKAVEVCKFCVKQRSKVNKVKAFLCNLNERF